MKRITTITASLLIAMALTACGTTETNAEGSLSSSAQYSSASSSSSIQNTPEPTENITFTYEPTPSSTPQPESSVQLLPIDVFENVEVSFEGWQDFGKVSEIKTDNCSELIRENVHFELDAEYTDLSNSDSVTVVAEYDTAELEKLGYYVLYDTKNYSVFGLRWIINTRNYSDDVVWVNCTDLKWYCCDKEGNVLFETSSEPTTNFADGVAIISEDRIVNKSGEEIWSIREDGTTYAYDRWGEENVTRIKLALYDAFFGYTFVEFHIDSYEYTGTFTGILNSDGSWFREPETVKYKNYLDYELINGYVPGLYECSELDSSDSYYVITPISGITEEDFDTVQSYIKTYYTNVHDGLFFEWNAAYTSGSFYNAEGKEIIDLSQYKLYSAEIPAFNDGYALIEFENDQGSEYYTIIDTAGNEMFSPKKNTGHGPLYCGYYAVSDIGYLDVYGEVAFGENFRYYGAFHQNMALIQVDGDYHFINTDGEIVY